MKLTLQGIYILLLLSGPIAWGQQNLNIRGRVIDDKTREPLPFVNISSSENSGSTTDLDGYFEISTRSSDPELTFSYIGYESQLISPRGKEMPLIISLKPKADELKEAVVFAGENPAHRIIKAVEANRRKNNPLSREAFSYKSYNKFFLAVNPDSIDSSIDTVERTVGDSTFTRIDSSGYRLSRFLEKKYFFFMESLNQRQYLAPSRDNETVLASRSSGINNALFSLIFTQMQSFSFYEDFINIGGIEYLNPISSGSTNRYFFILEDTLYNETVDSLFIISFRPRPNYGFRPMKGLLYISSKDWAIQNVIAEPAEGKEGIQIKIKQAYRRYGEHSWFPTQLNADIIFNSLLVNNQPLIGQMRSRLFEIKLDAGARRRDISRADHTIDDLALESADTLLARYRTDTADTKGLNTYHYLDSVVEAENLDELFDIYLTMASGKIPLGYVDLDLDRIISYNRFEGLRLGAGLHTSKLFSHWFKIGGYFGYGLNDKLWKYGGDVKMSLHKNSNLAIIGGYKYDLLEPGGSPFLQREERGIFEDNYRQLYIPLWDRAQVSWTGITYDILPKLQAQLRLQHEKRITLNNYRYLYDDTGLTEGRQQFNFSEVITSLRYSPNEKVLEGPEFGTMVLEKKYPVYYLQYHRGFKDFMAGDFDYHKLALRIDYRIKTTRWGVFDLGVQSGAVLSPLPFSKLYSGRANLYSNHYSLQSIGYLADRHSFETMNFNEFLTDRYLQFMFRQDLKSLLFRREGFAPHIEILSRVLWGDLTDPQRHQGMDFKVPRHAYLESGVEFNKLLDFTFFGMGLGFYYRHGAYSHPRFFDNLRIKLTAKFGS